MKKILSILLTLILFFSAYAQTYSTTWPYIYPDFTDGIIYMKGGQKINHKVNIHILQGRLHYIDNGVIKEAMGSEILFLEIGEDDYMVIMGDVMRVYGTSEKGFVARHSVGDFASLQDTGGAYGSSATTQATRKLSSIEVSGRVNQPHMELLLNKDAGQEVDLLHEYYLVTNDYIYKATKKGIMNELDDNQKKEFKQFLKGKKIKWKNPESLIQLLDFFNME